MVGANMIFPANVSTRTICFCITLTMLISGCSPQQNARVLIKHNTIGGVMMLNSLGTGEEMVRNGQISASLRITADDGVQIDTWVINNKSMIRDTIGTVVLLHGLLMSKAQNLELGEEFARAGFDVVLIDFRAHGRSTGEYVTWSAKEADDVKTVVDELLDNRFIHQPIFAWGISMGAATAINYASIDPRCRGVIAVAPFKDAKVITRGLLWYLFPGDYEKAWLAAGQIAQFNPAETSPMESAKQLHCHLVIVHGMLDAIVPYSHGQAIYNTANEPKELKLVPVAAHLSVITALGDEWFVDKMISIAKSARHSRSRNRRNPQAW